MSQLYNLDLNNETGRFNQLNLSGIELKFSVLYWEPYWKDLFNTNYTNKTNVSQVYRNELPRPGPAKYKPYQI